MGKPYIYPYIDKGYSNRHETRLYNPDGTQAPSFLITRYTFGFKPRPAEGPRGGKAKRMVKYNVFYRQGVFYRSWKVKPTEDSKWLNSYKPLEGFIFDAHPATSEKQGVPVVKIECIEGIPVSVKTEDGTEVWAWGYNPMSELEEMLHIPEQDRAQESIEAPADTVQNTAQELNETEAAQELEAARVAWLESTTEQGQQLDLMAYFGYGDATWQELAKSA